QRRHACFERGRVLARRRCRTAAQSPDVLVERVRVRRRRLGGEVALYQQRVTSALFVAAGGLERTRGERRRVWIAERQRDASATRERADHPHAFRVRRNQL